MHVIIIIILKDVTWLKPVWHFVCMRIHQWVFCRQYVGKGIIKFLSQTVQFKFSAIVIAFVNIISSHHLHPSHHYYPHRVIVFQLFQPLRRYHSSNQSDPDKQPPLQWGILLLDHLGMTRIVPLIGWKSLHTKDVLDLIKEPKKVIRKPPTVSTTHLWS